MKDTYKKIGISEENIEEINEITVELLKNGENKKDFEEAKKIVFNIDEEIAKSDDYELKMNHERKNHQMLMDVFGRIIERSGINKYTIYLVVLIYLLSDLKDKYNEKGLSDELFYETMKDISYKVKECKDVYGVLGVEPVLWFYSFYTCERFCLGRLQYEKGIFKEENYKDELKYGDTVLKCHIPSSGPLKVEDVIESLKEAYNFYKTDLKDGKLYVTCGSWLLYSKYKEIFPEGSNMRKFYNMFKIISDTEKPNNPDFWRVFNMNYEEGILEKVPRDNTLRRNLYEFMKKGNSMGEGYGVIVFDGEKIVN